MTQSIVINIHVNNAFYALGPFKMVKKGILTFYYRFITWNGNVLTKYCGQQWVKLRAHTESACEMHK